MDRTKKFLKRTFLVAVSAALIGAGALIGDQMQGQEIQNQRQDQQIRRSQAELDRQRQEVERLKRQQSEY